MNFVSSEPEHSWLPNYVLKTMHLIYISWKSAPVPSDSDLKYIIVIWEL